MRVFAAALATMGLSVEPNDLGVTLRNTTIDEVHRAMARLGSFSADDLDRLADDVKALQVGKFDAHVPEPLLRRLWARRHRHLVPAISSMAAGFHSEIASRQPLREPSASARG